MIADFLKFSSSESDQSLSHESHDEHKALQRRARTERARTACLVKRATSKTTDQAKHPKDDIDEFREKWFSNQPSTTPRDSWHAHVVGRAKAIAAYAAGFAQRLRAYMHEGGTKLQHLI